MSHLLVDFFYRKEAALHSSLPEVPNKTERSIVWKLGTDLFVSKDPLLRKRSAGGLLNQWTQGESLQQFAQ
jgi:hypothetical protein